MKLLGIDVGGSGIKAAIVNISTGELVSERIRIPTPKPSTPKLIAATIFDLVATFEWSGNVGCSFPTIVKNGKAHTSGNLSPKWKGVQIDALFNTVCKGNKFHVANDADLAGLAEMRQGAGRGLEGKVFMITIGTGLGSGIFYNSKLIPNIELGRIFYKTGKYVEYYAASSAKEKNKLSLEQWAGRFDSFLKYIDRVTAPDHFIIGGGLSKKFEKFEKYLTVDVPLHKAKFKNNAGIIGAALFASENL